MIRLKLVGGFGSPYSRKMRAVLRYRRVAFTWIMRGSAEDVGIPEVPVALIPEIDFPGENGRRDDAMIDSTSQSKRPEEMSAARRMLPQDPALALVDARSEDYADEG